MIRKLICTMLIFCCSIFAVGCRNNKSDIIYNDTSDDTELSEELIISSEEADTSKSDMLAVYVCGAVVNPGVYYLPEGSIKQDALLAAGGYADGASEWYVNLAEELSGGEQVYFPTAEELDTTTPQSILVDTEEHDSVNQHLVNINTADKEELMTLKAIGETRAEAIIAYREQHGDFTCIEDICKVNGIKDGIYEGIRDYITVD